MVLSERLVLLRKANSLSQEQLAEKIGISRQTVSRWETGDSSPTFNNLTALSEFYQIPLSQLLDTQEYFTPKAMAECLQDSAANIHSETTAISNPQKSKQILLRLSLFLVTIFIALLLVLLLLLGHTRSERVEMIPHEDLTVTPSVTIDGNFTFGW